MVSRQLLLERNGQLTLLILGLLIVSIEHELAVVAIRHPEVLRIEEQSPLLPFRKGHSRGYG